MKSISLSFCHPMALCLCLFVLCLCPKSWAQSWPDYAADLDSSRPYLVVDKPHMTLALMQGTDTLAIYPISCGRGYGDKQRRGDLRTPEGLFHITQIVDASQWGHDFGDGLGYIPHAYGPWFVRLSAGNGIGIHGTHDPGSMGLRASEGCIRLRNEDIAALRPRLRLRMQVLILPDRYEPIEGPKLLDLNPPIQTSSRSSLL